MPNRNEASAISAWWNAVKRFAEHFERVVPSGRSPKAAFDKLAEDLKLEIEALDSEIARMRPLVDRYENGILFKENTDLRRRNDKLRHKVEILREGNNTLISEVEALKEKVNRLETRLREALARPLQGPTR